MKGDKIKEIKTDHLITQLQLEEFLISSLWIKDKPEGIILVDNYVTKKPINDADIRIFNMFVEQAAGAIENSRAFEDTLIKAHTDTLTMLWNHGYFQYRLDEELLKAKSKNYPLSILMIDIDDFKKFNDTYGHIQGDKALREVSEALKMSLRELDIICRYGGEEFSIILPFADKDEAFNIAESLRKSLTAKEIVGNKFTISIGLASFPKDGCDRDSLVKKADVALYKAKREGKNKVVPAF
jgi:diguanylate cyclase (GGDEF)-like protein